MTQTTRTVITVILIVILAVSLVIRFLKLWYADRLKESEIGEEYETLNAESETKFTKIYKNIMELAKICEQISIRQEELMSIQKKNEKKTKELENKIKKLENKWDTK